MAQRPILEKVNLWRESGKGFKSRFRDEALPPVIERQDLSSLDVDPQLERGDWLQELRLKYYPSIDVNRDNIIAGKIDGDIDDAKERLLSLGFRNNPTAYVEVTEENVPDDGSYSRNIISESGGRLDIPRITQQPAFYRRVKEQIHVCMFVVDDGVEYLAHRERSAWLQPARHVLIPDSSARRGVRDFRDIWYDEFGEELPGKDLTKWDTTH